MIWNSLLNERLLVVDHLLSLVNALVVLAHEHAFLVDFKTKLLQLLTLVVKQSIAVFIP